MSGGEKGEALRREFAEWLSRPVKEPGEPTTQRDWALAHDVVEATLSRWKNDDDVQKWMLQYLRRRLMERAPDLVDTLISIGKVDRSAQAVVKALEMSGFYTPRQELTGNDSGPLQVVWKAREDKEGAKEGE